jgi:hypothetical protein
MKKSICKMAAGLCILAGTALHAQTVYTIEDRSIYSQDSSSTPTQVTGNTYGNPGPYNFRAQSDDNTYASVTGPDGTYTLSFDNTNSNYDYALLKPFPEIRV